MQLSVVIPFYQVEKYIGACLDALAALPAEESEILLVDDCGRDGSAAIAAAYCAAHPNARVIRRAQNGGLSAARNTGLDAARGEYVYFLDSDDVLRAEALWRLTQAAREKRLDVAKARFCFLNDETGELTDGAAIRPTDVLEGGALLAAQCQSGTYEPMVWQCVYRRAFLLENGLRMAEGLLFEDELFQAPALIRAKRAAAFDAVILEYRQRPGSIMASFARSAKWCASYAQVCARLDALARTLPSGAARAALQKRVGQIALSVGKNISAYRLPPTVAGEAMAFLKAHRRELAHYALKSGDAAIAAQGALLQALAEAVCGDVSEGCVMTGKLHVYTGDGKGKTTAAMGLALRSLGHGRRVLIAQFLKDGRSGELAALKTFERATVYPAKPISGFVFAMTAAQKEEAAKQQNAQAADIQSEAERLCPALTVLDELNVALACGMVTRENAERLIDAALAFGDVVSTGRNAPEWLREKKRITFRKSSRESIRFRRKNWRPEKALNTEIG